MAASVAPFGFPPDVDPDALRPVNLSSALGDRNHLSLGLVASDGRSHGVVVSQSRLMNDLVIGCWTMAFGIDFHPISNQGIFISWFLFQSPKSSQPKIKKYPWKR